MKKVKLGEVCEILSGYAFKSSQFNDNKIGLPLIRIRDVERGFSDTYFEGTYSEEYLIKNGDLLITMDGSFILKKWEGDLALLNQRVCKIKITDKSVDEGYISWLIPKFLKEIEDKTPFVTVKHLSVAKIKDISFVLPNKLEQKLIAKKLNTISQIYDFRKIQSEKFNELVKSRFNEMFGDFYTTLFPKYKIGEKFEVSSGSTPSRDNKLYWDSGTINWVKTTEVINREITETEEKITKFALENTSLKLFPVDTILIAMYGQGQTRGRSAILKVESTSNQACGAIFPNKIDNPVFIWHQLMLRYSELRELGRGGNQPNLNGQLIKNFELIFPPLALQNEFADFVAQVDKSQFACEIAIKVWRNSLKFSII
ncbi:restriction endonuclease subunit S [Streptococcus pseudopneumoniae]|uniref:Restriction endonuclease subunit S n=1 Tax=Streptococcus pseudopneumoniae TaxID=257758 RepID=A0A3A4RTK4_9STRE|nr:restriction endonuclease subunit S [Streptococcus pseudopneumoniae]MBF9650070.1 restriction endonuclease subunit S [Streptococcus pseudopneumoniae]MBF9672715.1 restriction endonuclease subunit S [Streptococcus pseudopneumoniae]MBW8118571.1 restriction endonuclease subunit S [Streptococcus pseudopneumoniae]RJP77734.1 restriction endonuclease subunit S [Streptococcus pseudopneumoniae]